MVKKKGILRPNLTFPWTTEITRKMDNAVKRAVEINPTPRVSSIQIRTEFKNRLTG